ncbi:MAG: MATE family efflux transporter [Eubacteriales bacterium]
MTETKIPKLIWSLAIPTIISMLITSFYNMADTFFVGKINTSATAAVGVVFSLMSIIQAVGFMFGHGSGNYIARMLGQKKMKETEIMVATGFFSSIIAGAIIMILGLLFLEPLAYALGSTDTILPYAKSYLKYILIGAPYMCASLVLNNQLRYQGSASYAAVGIVSGAIINIILDPILIFGFDMGIEGAAIATIVSQFIGFVLLLIGTTKGSNIRVKISKFSFDSHYFIAIICGGFPSLCRQGLASVATIFLNIAAGVYGDAAIAGMSIVSRITMFASSALIGFGQGFQPVCGFNYGAKLYKRVREAFYYCVKVSTIFLCVVACISIVFAPQLVTIFRKDDMEVIAIGSSALRYTSLAIPLTSWIILCNMMLQAIGKTTKASILASARQGLFFLPLLFILSRVMGLNGIIICQATADLCTFILALPLGLSVLKEMKENI